MGETVLEYESGTIGARLERSEKTLVQGVCFSIRAGESLALIGETGSGKTMIAMDIMGLLPANVRAAGGRAALCGRALTPGRGLRERLGVELVYIPQNGLEFLDPAKRVRGHLCDSLRKLGVPRREWEGEAASRLAAAGFDEPGRVLDLYPFQLSGGMAQRVTIAVSACSRARLVIADEPTNGLDQAARRDFMALLDRLFPEAARLVITHDIAVAELCGETLVLCGGRMMERGPTAEVIHRPRQPYTRALIGALVKNGMRASPRLRREAGLCPYYRRCPQAAPPCRTQLDHRREGETEWWCSG